MKESKAESILLVDVVLINATSTNDLFFVTKMSALLLRLETTDCHYVLICISLRL